MPMMVEYESVGPKTQVKVFLKGARSVTFTTGSGSGKKNVAVEIAPPLHGCPLPALILMPMQI